MRNRGPGAVVGLCLALLLAVSTAGCGRRVPTFDGGELGPVRLYRPSGAATGFVFLVSDRRGWSRRLDRSAKRLRDAGMIVAGVDAADILWHLRRPEATADAEGGEEQSTDSDCLDMRAAFETTSQEIQKSLGVQVYMLPVLAGVGEGATLAAAGLWQAGPQTFAGAATVNFVARLRGPGRLCADPSTPPTPERAGWVYAPPARLDGWWRATWTQPAAPGALDFAKTAGAGIVDVLPGASPARQVAKLVSRAAEAGEGEPLKLGGLEVVELPGRPGSDTLVMILSGDGGWRDLDRQLGHIVSAAGVPVVGIDCLRYFWSPRQPDAVARDFDSLIADAVERTGARKIALVGFSFGADVLPAVYNRLDDASRARVALLTLLSPEKSTPFEIHIEGWLGANSEDDASPLAPELARLDPRLVQCIYGEEEADDSGCLDPSLKTADVVRMPGGHHFDEDYDKLARLVLQRLNE